jgi:uncharacterized membrane protein
VSKSRLEAFTDAVIAIVMTILVLELVAPAQGSFAALFEMRFEFLVYLISFTTLAIYWQNHHHLLQISRHVSGAVLWANTALLLFLSLIPFTTSWVNEHLLERAPELMYGGVMLICDLIWLALARALIAENGTKSHIARALDGSRKSYLSIGLVAAGMAAGLLWPPLTLIFCVLSLIPWIIPDKRIEQMLHDKEG